MYNGKLLDELLQMVTRAEEHARELKAEQAEPEPYAFYASRLIYDRATPQQPMVGAA